MKFRIKREHGMTLVEVLAALVITSVVAIFIFSIIQSSVEQNVKQKTEADILFDITYALKIVTKDIRRSIDAIATTSELNLKLPDASEVIYYLEEGYLKRKPKGKVAEVITDNIGCAQFIPHKKDVILIKLSYTNNCEEGRNTIIHLRKGS